MTVVIEAFCLPVTCQNGKFVLSNSEGFVMLGWDYENTELNLSWVLSFRVIMSVWK